MKFSTFPKPKNKDDTFDQFADNFRYSCRATKVERHIQFPITYKLISKFLSNYCALQLVSPLRTKYIIILMPSIPTFFKNFSLLTIRTTYRGLRVETPKGADIKAGRDSDRTIHVPRCGSWPRPPVVSTRLS